jgi:hypothetical protein
MSFTVIFTMQSIVKRLTSFSYSYNIKRLNWKKKTNEEKKNLNQLD